MHKQSQIDVVFVINAGLKLDTCSQYNTAQQVEQLWCVTFQAGRVSLDYVSMNMKPDILRFLHLC